VFCYTRISIEEIQSTFASNGRTLLMAQIQNITASPITIYSRVMHEPVQGWPWVALRSVAVNDSSRMKHAGNVRIS